MASLLVRQIDEGVVARLKARAQRNGRSAEAEHRAILEEALPERTPMGPILDKWLQGARWTYEPSGVDQSLRIPDFSDPELDRPKDHFLPRPPRADAP